LSGFLFALAHINAATMIPLWFLGIAFAWLYVRTGTLLAPMAVHFTFNAVNLFLCLFF
ncbi:MAG: CPBP family intramembrane metalloprotease, partial [Victivallales bacterium]|nr:CPBP family intramembrane metalloprotease [Victivallales bacterium]